MSEEDDKMINQQPCLQDLYTAFPFVARLDEEAMACFRSQAVELCIPAGTPVASEVMNCTHLPLVLSGSARIVKISDTGREIILYRIACGDICILTTCCIMSDISFPASAVAEDDLRVVSVPAVLFRHWMQQSESWQTYVFGQMAQRFADVMTVIDELVFRRMDSRLAAHL